MKFGLDLIKMLQFKRILEPWNTAILYKGGHKKRKTLMTMRAPRRSLF